MQIDGRRFVPELALAARVMDDGKIALSAPAPGLFRGGPAPGALVTPGSVVGELEILGVLHRLRAPSDAFGVVTAAGGGRRLGRRPVDAATVIVVLDPEAVSGAQDASIAHEKHGEASGPVFETPLGGRYYARPAPDADPFVKVGDVIQHGTTVALIEVMKTFNRVSYGGPGTPPRARVKRIVRADGDDIEAGDVLLELESE